MTRHARGGAATVAGLVAVIGIATGNPYWVLFGVVALLVTGLAEAWWRWGATGLEYRRTLSAATATCGDAIDCTIEVTNRKVLPMPWIDVLDDWPAVLLPDRVRARGRGWGAGGLPPIAPPPVEELRPAPPDRIRGEGDGRANDGPTLAPARPVATALPAGDIPQQTDREALAQRLTLAPFERVRRRYVLPCRRRGAYAFGPVDIRWRDAFGLAARSADLDLRDSLVVYPRVVPVVAPAAAARQLLGDRVRPRALLADPSRLAGVRPFVTGDSVRRVHWRASARTGTLQVRRDDPTAGRRLMIVLDVETVTEDRWWSAGDTDVHETLAMVAASLAAWALADGTSVGVTANGRTGGSAGDLWVPCAGNPRQLPRVLDALARLRPWPSRPLRDAVAITARAWPPDATVAYVTAMPSASKEAAVARAARGARRVVTIDCSPNTSGGNGVTVPSRRAAPPAVEADPAGLAPGAPWRDARVAIGASSWRLADAATSWQARSEVRLVPFGS